jgi:AhpD family alkylhydroperoxidase
MPVSALPGTWEEMKSLQLNPKTALPAKAKELIGLGVAAQIPCMYCVQAHREFARAAGASEAEIGDAVAMSALTRHWSTYLNGIQLDPARFKQDLTRMTDHAKKMMQSKAPPAAPLAVTDGASALADIKQSLGFVPEFLQRFPEAGRAGAWKAMRDVEMNPNTALNGKFKTLVGLAVSSQIPCTYCIQADTEFSKVEGATEAERNEAIAMAALTRHMSTLLNGMRTDENQFASDLSRLVKNAQASRTTAPGTQPRTR